MKNNNFLQPVISVIGLAVSLITALLPIFNLPSLSGLFVIKELVQPISFLAFIFSIVIIWYISTIPYLEVHLGRLKDRGNGYPDYWKRLDVYNLVWIALAFCLLFGSFFLIVQFLPDNLAIQLLQSLSYLLFFVLLVAIFAMLFTQTKRVFDWEEERDNFPQTVFQTLERNRLVKPWIEIYENRAMTQEEAISENIQLFGMMKKMKVKTSIQKEEVIEFIISSDGKQLVKVIKKQEQN